MNLDEGNDLVADLIKCPECGRGWGRSLEDRMAEALWIACEPWRWCCSYSGQIAWADADKIDRDLYYTRARVVIEQLGLER